MLARSRFLSLTIVSLALLLGVIAGPGCSSKSADPDTAEVVPDPVIKPAPIPTPPAEPASKNEPTATPPTADPKP